jgi:DNA repair exonuclease SbcCD ATPase subunit
MRINKLTISGIGPFRSGPATIDLSAYGPGQIVALVGANGAGKSTTLRALAAVVDKSERQSIGARAVARDAFVGVELDGPAGLTQVRFSFDSQSGKSEALALGADYIPILPTTSVRAWDDWCGVHMMAPEVYRTTLYAGQGAGGWIGLPTADRRRIVLRALGIEHLEKLSQRARDRSGAAKAGLVVLDAQIAAEARAATVDASEKLVVETRAELGRTCVARAKAQDDLDEARRDHAALVAAYEDARNARLRYAAADTRLATAREALRAVSDRQEAAAAVLRGAEDVERAARDLPAVRESAERAEATLAGLRASIAAEETAVRAAQGEAMAAERRAAEAMAAEDRALRATRDLPKAREAERNAIVYRAEVELFTAVVKRNEEEIEKLRGATLDVAGKRIVGLREGLQCIALSAYTGVPDGVAAASLQFDDETAREAASAPGKIEETRGALILNRNALDGYRKTLAAAESLAARLPDLERAAEESGRAVSAAVEANRVLAATKSEADRLARELSVRRAALVTAETEAKRWRSERAKLEVVSSRASEISAARARAEELLPARAAAEAELAAAREEVRLCPEPPAEAPLPPDLSRLEAALLEAERVYDAAARVLAGAEAARDAALAAAGRVADLEVQRGVRQRDLADLVLLASALGQGGLIAREVDAVGPELAATANSLLRAGFGTRWTLDIQTVRPKADGSGDVEVCDVTVLDTHTGFTGSVEELSGGEAVVVSEAIRMALTALAVRRMGISAPTLIRDEPGSALSPVSPIEGCETTDAATVQHLRMLREAARLAGANVLLISHDPSIPPLCDAVVTVRDGKFQRE